MNFPFDKQRIGDMADILDLKFSFERKPEFQGHKEESARELYNWLRDQERRHSHEPTTEKNLSFFVHWKTDGDFTIDDAGLEEFASSGEAQEFIDQKVTIHGDDFVCRTFRGESIIIVPKAAEPAQPTASQGA